MDEPGIKPSGETTPNGLAAQPAPASPDAGREAGPVAAPEPASSSARGGLRLLAAVVTLPWLFAYGVLGTWAVVRAARAISDGADRIEAGYVHPVSPAGLLMVGALLLAAFATLLALALLLLWGSRRVAVWSTVAVAGWLLTAGAIWAALAGRLYPGLWFVYFFGIGYAAVVATVIAVRVTRRAAAGTIVAP